MQPTGLSAAVDHELESLYDAQKASLWGLAYRLTGSAEDADDVLQESFKRLLETPPDHDHLGPWLVRVATNLGVDALRRRRRERYSGPWLPAAVEADDERWLASVPANAADPETRYGLLESATFAFLLAAEALRPRQRAVLILRDVFGYSAVETAAVLATSEGNVRQAHLRARRAMESYDRTAVVPTPELRHKHEDALQRFLGCLLAQDAGALEAMLAESVETMTDAGGHYTALKAPLRGRAKVARFYLRAAAERTPTEPRYEIRTVNALPAVVIELGRPVRRQAPRSVVQIQLDQDGRVNLVRAVLAPAKIRVL